VTNVTIVTRDGRDNRNPIMLGDGLLSVFAFRRRPVLPTLGLPAAVPPAGRELEGWRGQENAKNGE